MMPPDSGKEAMKMFGEKIQYVQIMMCCRMLFSRADSMAWA